jgi:hypothetical protein
MKELTTSSAENRFMFVLIVWIIQMFTGNGYSQQGQPPLAVDIIPGIDLPIADNANLQTTFYRSFEKRPGRYGRDDWQNLIDSVWGPGLPTAEKLMIFDNYWNKIDSSFACFQNIEINWDSLKSVYRPEIAAGVSKGRFAAILSHMNLLLHESHSLVYDNEVVNTYASPGIPLFVISGIGFTGFGAALTPLADSSLLVYNAINSHPFGLQRGDIILGYDRTPWKILYKQLIEWELPIAHGNWIGSSSSSFTHSLLRAAGRNWHLFDTIDIVKFSSGDTIHLPTSLMNGQYNPVYNTEQMDIAGVPKPVDPEIVSYGIVQGTNIGYIYVWGWYNDADVKFAQAVQNLLQTDGLIIDFRFNLGGNMFLSNPGLSLLFDSSYSTIDFGQRCSPGNHLMCPLNISGQYIITGNPPGYNKPIAVLTGQGAVSSGDQVALRLKYHRRARFFGKSTSTAFNSPAIGTLHPDFVFVYVPYDSYELNNPGVYLTHKEFTVDEDVWLTPAKVAQGRDDVVEAALDWINTLTGISAQSTEVPQQFGLSQNYPNPFNPVTKIRFDLAKSGSGMSGANGTLTKLVIFDILGREIATLVNKQLVPGTYEVDWNAGNQSSGVYFYRLISGDFVQTKKMLLNK